MNIEERHNKAVNRIIKPLLNDPATQGIFLMWPVLAKITERFCDFVSPLMPYDERTNLVGHAIQKALASYRKTSEDRARPAAYITELVNAAPLLSTISVQGISGDIMATWEPFVEPMKVWMTRNNVQTLRTSFKGETPKGQDAIVAKRALLAHILTASEIQNFEIYI